MGSFGQISGPAARNVTAKTANYAAASGEVVLMDASGGARTVTSPAAAANTYFDVKKVDTSGNLVTVTPASGTIDGVGSYVLAVSRESVSLVCDGTNWHVI